MSVYDMNERETMTTRVLLADGQALLREAVREILGAHGDLEVVAEAADGRRALSEAARVRPHVAVVSSVLGPDRGVEVIPELLAVVPECRVLLLAGEEDLGELVRAVEAGASGYVARSSPLAVLIGAVRAASQGEVAIPPSMLGPLIGRLLKDRRQYDEATRQVATLTRREREVLYLLAQGADNETIGRTLVISPQTARTHIQNILAKLRVHSRLEAAALVRRSGILDELVPV
jgi:DNA-binding NarL/FixJ family response regulator